MNDTPLTPAVLHILLSLADGEKHGYAMSQFVARQSDGDVKLGPGTLYGTLKRLLEAGWVSELSERPPDDDPRRRYYRLTESGETVLRAELARMNRLLLTAGRCGLLSEARI